MKRIDTFIEGLYILEPVVHGDERGWFVESYNKSNFSNIGIDTVFVQDNHSMSSTKNVLRGLHFQTQPKAQTKLIRCTKGRILDVAVDLRKDSKTYLKWFSIELSYENKLQLYIPQGFAHGFKTLTDDVEVQYKVDEFYSKENDRSIRYDDPDINVYWGEGEPILSEKDRLAPFLKDCQFEFALSGGTQ